MYEEPGKSHAASERLARAVLDDPAMLDDPAVQEWFFETLAELPARWRVRIAEIVHRHLPAVARATVKRAIVDRDGDAMRLLRDVLAGRTGNARMRALMLEALGGESES